MKKDFHNSDGAYSTEIKSKLSEEEVANIDKPYVNVVIETKNKDDFVKMTRSVEHTVGFSVIHALINIAIDLVGYYFFISDSRIVYSLNNKYKDLKNNAITSNNELEEKKKSLKQKKLKLRR